MPHRENNFAQKQHLSSNKERGIFITFEGGRASGKTTQSQMLYEEFKSKSIPVVCTREIGGTEISETIRDLVLNNQMESMTELLLSMAARYEHCVNLINTSLSSGISVICDRFVDSTAVYRNINNAIPIDTVYMFHSLVFGNFWPDITFLIDTPEEITQKRMMERNRKSDKFEKLDIDFHREIREKFRIVAQKYEFRIKTINGNKESGDIFKEILNHLSTFINQES